MTQPWRPGLNVLRGPDVPAWRPCLTRARGENDQPLVWEHAWFLDVGGTGYCFTCRASRPRGVFGPEWWIEDIRAAMDRGDQRLVRELVQRGPVEIEEQDFAPNRAQGNVGRESRDAVTRADSSQVSDLAVVGGRNDAPVVTAGETPSGLPANAELHGYEGQWTRRRTDVFDVDAIDPVYSQVWFGTAANDYDEFVVERAAIFEYLGGIPRPVAEVKARQLGGARPRERTR